MILTETKERVCVWGLFYLLTVVLWIKILGREKEIPWGISALILLSLCFGASNSEVLGLQMW